MRDRSTRPGTVARALRHPFAVAVVFALVAGLAGIDGHSFWSPDEPREAQMSREMLESGFSAMPTLGHEPFLEKPPLFFWMAAASYKVFGVNEAAERLPAALCAALATLFAYSIARHTSGRRTGLIAAVLAASFATFWTVGHRGANDAVLGAAVAGGHALLVRARSFAERGRGLVCGLGAGLACGVAFMAKGLIGPALIAGPATLAWLALRDGVTLRRVFPWFAFGSFVFVAAFGVPWAVALSHHPGGWRNVYDCTLAQAIGRTLGDDWVGAHSQPPYYYFLSGWGALMPWVVFLPFVLLHPAARRRVLRRPLLDAVLLLAFGVLLLTIPSGKRTSYLFPLLPVAAAVPADWLARVRRGERFGRIGLRWFTGLAALAGVAIAGIALLLGAGQLPVKKLEAIAEAGMRPSTIATAVVTLLLAVWLFRLFLKMGRPDRFRSGVREFVAFVAVGLVLSHVVGRRFLDPIDVLHPAARALAAAVPANEPMVSFNANETMRAMVPFYGGRYLIRIKTSDVLGELKSLGARHLIVQNDKASKLPPDVLRSLRPVITTRKSDGFDATVFEVVEGGP